MDIQYDLSAAELLKILGYSQPAGRDFLGVNFSCSPDIISCFLCISMKFFINYTA